MQKPIDICLNLKFEKGKLVYNNNLESFMVYNDSLEPRDMPIRLENKIFFENTNMFSRIEVNEN